MSIQNTHKQIEAKKQSLRKSHAVSTVFKFADTKKCCIAIILTTHDYRLSDKKGAKRPLFFNFMQYISHVSQSEEPDLSPTS